MPAHLSPNVFYSSNPQMLAIKRNVITGRYPILIGFIIALGIFRPANATYIAGMFNDDIAVIGADGLMINTSDNATITAQACKIEVLNTTSAFAPMGLAPQFMFGFAQNAAVGATNILDMVARFNNVAVAGFNSLPPNITIPSRPDRGFATAIFVGMNNNGSMDIADSRITFDPETHLFSASEIFRHRPNSLVGFVAKDETSQIMRESEFSTVASSATVPIQKFPRLIELIIKGIIDRDHSFGGGISVLVLQKHSRPAWYSRATQCPDLN